MGEETSLWVFGLGRSTNKFQKYSDTLAPRHATKYEVAGAKAPRRPNTFEIC